jgi:hypothetical protein
MHVSPCSDAVDLNQYCSVTCHSIWLADAGSAPNHAFGFLSSISNEHLQTCQCADVLGSAEATPTSAYAKGSSTSKPRQISPVMMSVERFLPSGILKEGGDQ